MASSPRVVTPPTVHQEVDASESTSMRRSRSSSHHSATVSIHRHGCLNPRLTFAPICKDQRLPCNLCRILPAQIPNFFSTCVHIDFSSLIRSQPTWNTPRRTTNATLLFLCPIIPAPVSFRPAEPVCWTKGARFLNWDSFLSPFPHTLGPVLTPSLNRSSTPKISSLLTCETHSISLFPVTQEAFDLGGFNFTPGAGQFDLGEMFDWENVLGDGKLRLWCGDWEGVGDTCATALNLGSGEFEPGEGLGGDDGHGVGVGVGLNDTGINLAVGPSVGLDTAVGVPARVWVPAVLRVPRGLASRQTTADSSSESSGPIDPSGNGSGSDELSFRDPSTFPISNYAHQLQALQSYSGAQSLWGVPIEESSLSFLQ